ATGRRSGRGEAWNGQAAGSAPRSATSPTSPSPGVSRRSSALDLGGGCGYGHRMAGFGAVLIDIDGVLTVSWKPLEGAVAALRRLRAAGLPLALVTNTTSPTRAPIAAPRGGGGLAVPAADIFSAPVIAAAHLSEHYPDARCLLLNSGDISEDLAGVALAGAGDLDVEVVLVGGAGPEFSYQLLNAAFGHLQRGARLVAMHRGLYWRTDE